MTPAPPDPTLPARLRAFHERLPLAGDRGTLPDDQVVYLAAILRDTPVPAPALSPEEWQGFRDVLRPHGVYPSWRTGCRPGRRTAGPRSRSWTT